ncbi:hypothetical protein CAEBREN_05647 [Caenorhabditis brenneri]|uniref:Uncharacterized protein n=1 Tax=Caenorhabditis brenneri TaxID=135651 RepID=G0NML4_CAEBE|nr:hypothetical protein CAEBREN_05647 [Caenorhabditis brenneri]
MLSANYEMNTIGNQSDCAVLGNCAVQVPNPCDISSSPIAGIPRHLNHCPIVLSLIIFYFIQLLLFISLSLCEIHISS